MSLMPIRGECPLDDEGRPVMGVIIAQDEGNLDIRLLIEPAHLASMAGLLARTSYNAFRIAVWPYKHLWEWDGKEALFVRDWKIEAAVMLESSPRKAS